MYRRVYCTIVLNSRAAAELSFFRHFYGRAAAGPSFSDLVLGTFTGTLTTVIAYNNFSLYL